MAKGIKGIIELVQSGKEYPALSLLKRQPEIATTLSKLVKARETRRIDPNDPSSFYHINQTSFTELSESIKDNIRDADNTKQLFPDLELAAQILISSILSPKDMVSTDIIYRVDQPLFGHELTSKLLEAIQTYIETEHNLTQLLPDILREVLFDTGSYVLATLPESSVDDIINGHLTPSTESLSPLFRADRSAVELGILGPPVPNTVALESTQRSTIPSKILDVSLERPTVVPHLHVEVSDNYQLLKYPAILDAQSKRTIRTRIAQESKPLEALFYKNPQYQAVPFLSIKTKDMTSRRTLGPPLALRLPSESVIPVHVPGNPAQHIGYFVLIDSEGYPISKSTNSIYLNEMQQQLNHTTGSLSSFLLQKARRNMVSTSISQLTVPQASQIYSDIIEADLLQRLNNGVYGRRLGISRRQDVFQIMLARSLSNQYTRLLYIPVELVTYFAIQYHDNGVGQSLMDNLKILTSLRAILLFAKVMALTKNSIAVTHVNMTLDPNDPDPQKTIEVAVHEIIKMRQQYFPLGINSPLDLVDWIQRAGFEFTFEGHPGLPQTKFDFETKNLQHQIPDSELEELLRKQTLMAIGLSPEIVDNGFNAEFATTVIANNILLSKRVTQLQNKFTPKVSQYVQQLCYNDSALRMNCLNLMKQHQALVEKVLDDSEKEKFSQNQSVAYATLLNQFIDTIEIALPKPDITTIHEQTEAYNEYSDSLEKALEAWLNQESLSTELIGELSGSVDALKTTIKSYFLRRWMAENGFMPELAEMTAVTEEGDPSFNLYDIVKDYNQSLMQAFLRYMQSLKPLKDAADEDLERLQVDLDEPSDTSGSEDSGDEYSSEGEDNFGDDFGSEPSESESEESEPEEAEPEESETEEPM